MGKVIPNNIHFVHADGMFRLEHAQTIATIAKSCFGATIYLWLSESDFSQARRQFELLDSMNVGLPVSFLTDRMGHVTAQVYMSFFYNSSIYFRSINTLVPLTNVLHISVGRNTDRNKDLRNNIVGLWALHQFGGIYVSKEKVISISPRQSLPVETSLGIYFAETDGVELPFSTAVIVGSKGHEKIESLCGALAQFQLNIPAKYLEPPEYGIHGTLLSEQEKNVELVADVFQPSRTHSWMSRALSNVQGATSHGLIPVPYTGINADLHDFEGVHRSVEVWSGMQQFTQPLNENALLYDWIVRDDRMHKPEPTDLDRSTYLNVDELKAKYSVQQELRYQIRFRRSARD